MHPSYFPIRILCVTEDGLTRWELVAHQPIEIPEGLCFRVLATNIKDTPDEPRSETEVA